MSEDPWAAVRPFWSSGEQRAIDEWWAIIKAVLKDGKSYTIIRSKGPVAIVLPWADWKALLSTVPDS